MYYACRLDTKKDGEVGERGLGCSRRRTLDKKGYDEFENDGGKTSEEIERVRLKEDLITRKNVTKDHYDHNLKNYYFYDCINGREVYQYSFRCMT